jgi:hypothetical protein
MKARNPNTGPYVVSWTDWKDANHRLELHTWTDACKKMRELVIDGMRNVSVAFC